MSGNLFWEFILLKIKKIYRQEFIFVVSVEPQAATMRCCNRLTRGGILLKQFIFFFLKTAWHLLYKAMERS